MSPAEGWTVWNEEPDGQLVLAYRPDVFDAEAHPPECLPTITVARGRSPDQRLERRSRDSSWYRALYLEPAVRVRAADASYDDRASAVEGARTLASAFAAGEVAVRDAYREPREAYLETIESLVGGSAGTGEPG